MTNMITEASAWLKQVGLSGDASFVRLSDGTTTLRIEIPIKSTNNAGCDLFGWLESCHAVQSYKDHYENKTRLDKRDAERYRALVGTIRDIVQE